MILKEHTRNQKRMYRIHKLEERIEKDKYIIGKQQQQIAQLTNNWNELEEWIKKSYYKYSGEQINALQDVIDKMKEIKKNEK